MVVAHERSIVLTLGSVDRITRSVKRLVYVRRRSKSAAGEETERPWEMDCRNSAALCGLNRGIERNGLPRRAHHSRQGG